MSTINTSQDMFRYHGGPGNTMLLWQRLTRFLKREACQDEARTLALLLFDCALPGTKTQFVISREDAHIRAEFVHPDSESATNYHARLKAEYGALFDDYATTWATTSDETTEDTRTCVEIARWRIK